MTTVPATPHLHVDAARLRLNIRRAAELARAHGVALRPHVKTHKSPDIARLQVASGAQGITVATLGEAEVFAAQGFDDILVAYPVWVDHDRASRARELLDRGVRLAIGVDSPEGVAQAGRLLGRTPLAVLVEVDSGHHRTGVPPRRAGPLADAARRAGLSVAGVFTFPGHSYAPGAAAEAARDEAVALTVAAESLRDLDIEPAVLSGGSTPSLAASDVEVVTELRPGVYALGDAQQWELGVMPPEQIALTCRATVVSHAGGRAVLDAGSKVLGADRAGYATGFGRLPALPEARVVMLSEHHAVVDVGDAPLPAVGSIVEVVPNHVCNAINLVDELFVDDGSIRHRWPVAGRGRLG